MSKQLDKGVSLLLIALAILSGSCANRVVPQGGPVDEDPPVLLSSNPENMSVGFNTDKVVFRFDEYVKLENQDQIFVSPPLNSPPRYRANGKEVIVELPDDLRSDITYTINFGNAIVDNNEGNAFGDFKYVFSTGDAVDSLTLIGSVYRAEDLKPEKDGIVVLYPDTLPDSSVFRTMPTYYSRLDEQGNFTIDNIREGVYRLFAIEDANKNFLGEIPSERVAFRDSLLALPADDPETLYSFRQQPSMIKVLSSKCVAPGISMIAFNGPSTDVDVELIYNDLIHTEYNRYGDTLWVYHTTVNDSTGIMVRDELASDTLWTFRKVSSATASEKLYTTGYARKGNDSLYVSFNKPFLQGDAGGAYLDSLPLFYIVDENEKGIGNGIIIPRPDSSASLFLNPGTFIDIHGEANDSINLQINIPDERQTGILELDVSPSPGTDTYVVVTDASWNRIDKSYIAQPSTFEITWLMPGKYILSSFLDENGDSEWTPGDFYVGRQPEKVMVNEDEIVIRANWTIQLKWEIER